MRSITLQHYLEHPDLRSQLIRPGDDTIIGIGRDPKDARRTCIVLYVPSGFDKPVPETITVGDEAVRVIKRERGGPLLAY